MGASEFDHAIRELVALGITQVEIRLVKFDLDLLSHLLLDICFLLPLDDSREFLDGANECASEVNQRLFVNPPLFGFEDVLEGVIERELRRAIETFLASRLFSGSHLVHDIRRVLAASRSGQGPHRNGH